MSEMDNIVKVHFFVSTDWQIHTDQRICASDPR